jgi:ribosomal protein L7/L12
MEIEQLDQQAERIFDIAKYMNNVFGRNDGHLRIAIMAGVGDAYNAGYQAALQYHSERKHLGDKIIAENKITWELKETIFALAKINRLEAIKDLKKETGMLLKDAKEFVDKLMLEDENMQS